MATSLRRRQQKLLGFGSRWQTADPSVALHRAQEVHKSLTSLQEAYEQQRRLQDERSAESACMYNVKEGRVVLTRRRGQIIESFGRREDGEWILDVEEMLYLAERGNLAVFREDGGVDLDAEGQKNLRRLAIEELYGLTMKTTSQLSVDSYAVYAHLRRSGFAVKRKGNSRIEEATSKDKQYADADVPSGDASSAPQSSWLVLPALGKEEPFCSHWHVPPSTSNVEACDASLPVHVVCPDDIVMSTLLKAPLTHSFSIAAVSNVAFGNPVFLELGMPIKPGKRKGDAKAHNQCVAALDEGTESSSESDILQVEQNVGIIEAPAELLATHSTAPSETRALLTKQAEEPLHQDCPDIVEGYASIAARVKQMSAEVQEAKFIGRKRCKRGGGQKQPSTSKEDSWLL